MVPDDFGSHGGCGALLTAMFNCGLFLACLLAGWSRSVSLGQSSQGQKESANQRNLPLRCRKGLLRRNIYLRVSILAGAKGDRTTAPPPAPLLTGAPEVTTYIYIRVCI